MNKDNTIEPDKLKVELRVVLKQQWSSAYRAGHNGKMLAQLITEPIIEDAVINKIFALFNKYSKQREIDQISDFIIECYNHDSPMEIAKELEDERRRLEATLKDNYGK